MTEKEVNSVELKIVELLETEGSKCSSSEGITFREQHLIPALQAYHVVVVDCEGARMDGNFIIEAFQELINVFGPEVTKRLVIKEWDDGKSTGWVMARLVENRMKDQIKWLDYWAADPNHYTPLYKGEEKTK